MVMQFVKIKKNKAYHSRFQVKWRRRREGKTDYYSRKRLICQDKRKYTSPKYRLVVRKTKKNIICQFVQPKIEGDHVLCAVYSGDLCKYGILLSFTSFPSSYLSGVLLAKKISKNESLEIKKKKTERKTLRKIFAILDIGLGRATKGHKVFAAMKGAVDGGITIPHKGTRFPPMMLKLDEKNLKIPHIRVFGQHIALFMKITKEEDEEFYNRQFSSAIRKKIEPKHVYSMFVKGLDAILNGFPLFEKETNQNNSN